jgi:DNA polymerase
VQARGHQLKGLTKRSVSAVLAGDPGDDVRQLLGLRGEGSRAAVRKLDSLFASVDADNRVRGTLKFHGAAPGRWSGRGFQPQNLKRPETKDLDAAVAAILAGDVNRIRALGPPLTVVGDVSRSIVCATLGDLLLSGDFSAAESRGLAWLAGEDWKLEVYRQFDRTGDPSVEPYCVTAGRVLQRTVTPDDEAGRQTGKTCDLAFGYGGGLGAWRRFDSSDTHADADVERFKREWREQHAATVRFWRALEGIARRAIRSGQRITLGRLAAEYENGTLYLVLPSGRRLAYPGARVGPGKFDAPQIYFMDNARGAWTETCGWYGSFTENVVQAVCRDLLAAAMVRLEAAGYPVVLHVHDEIVVEVPERSVDADAFLRLVLELPEWAEGFPFAAKIRTGGRYAKTKDPQPKPVAPQAIECGARFAGNGRLRLAEPVATATAEVEIELPRFPPLADVIGQPLANGKICCPFHDDSTPSLHVYPDHYHCFGCGARGNHVDWLMLVEEMRRDEAIELLENWHGPGLDGAGAARRRCARARQGGAPVGAGWADRRHAGGPVSREPGHRRGCAAGRRRGSAALSPALPVRPRDPASVPRGTVPRRRDRRAGRHSPCRIDRGRAEDRPPHARPLAGAARDQAVAGERRAVHRRRHRDRARRRDAA